MNTVVRVESILFPVGVISNFMQVWVQQIRAIFGRPVYLVIIGLTIINDNESFGQDRNGPVHVCPCNASCSSVCSDLFFDTDGICPECGMTLQLYKISATDILSEDQMRQDVDFAYRKLLENHVNPYLHISSEEFELLYQDIRASLNKPLSRLEFYLTVSRLVTALRDGHTAIDFPMPYYDSERNGLHFPLRVELSKSGIIVREVMGMDLTIERGDQILSINGKSYQDIVTDFGTLINDVRPLFDVYARLFNELLWFRYGSAKEFDIVFSNQNGMILRETVSGIPKAEVKPNILEWEKDFDFRMPEDGIGILTFNRMFKADEFDHFLDSTFREIKVRNVENLIIDVRKNGGGRGRMADSLFNYLTQNPYKLFSGIKYKISEDLKNLYLGDDPNHTDPVDSAFVMTQPNGVVADFLKHTQQSMITVTPNRKENVFKGKVFLLTSNNTFSGGALIAGIFKCNSMGKIIGVEPAQTTMFVADHTYVTLPNSKLNLGISFVELHLPCEQSYYSGIRPDYEVELTAPDIKNGVDTQLGFVMKLIKGD